MSGSANGNDRNSCIDCGALNVAMVVQSIRVCGELRHWFICGPCLTAHARRK
jgi:hypothetical protein